MSRQQPEPGWTRLGRAKPTAVQHVPAPTAAALRDIGENALVAVRRWADPRERELRRRRRARRTSLRLGTAGGLTTVGAVGLVVLSAPVWAVVVLGGGAVALVTGGAISARRYLRLRQLPLPQAAYQPRKLPPLRSAARTAAGRLDRAERALHALVTQIARTGRLPLDELADLRETAASGAAALAALITDVQAMEQAVDAIGQANPATAGSLRDTVRAAVARLDAGVAEYEQLVAAAGGLLAVPETGVVHYNFDVIVADLRHAADRLDGWAQALTELADDGRAPLPPHGR
ncbi:hypothetical protein AB0H71_27885 [Nocardia sp. NPDC050697]|uniref:phage shock envelope stress response protein PspM n=1 Tax=Nocardia sp. NPDC050697 TaxID=3155158 RepID=UPI0033FE5740